jgi:hypothetical protein
MTTTITNGVPLDTELKKHFQELFRAVKKNTIALAKQAFQIHSEHYSRVGRIYDKDFEVWWGLIGWTIFLAAVATGQNGIGLAKQ